MKIKKYPDDRVVQIDDIKQGECFILLEDINAGDTQADCEWNAGDIFMCCDVTAHDTAKVVNLEVGIIDEFHIYMNVEKVNAQVVCE